MTKSSVRSLAKPLLCAAAVLGAFSAVTSAPATAQTATVYDDAAVQKGLQISPVPLDMTGKDRNQVGYGSYLVNAAGGCNDCHTNPNFKADGDPFKGMKKAINTEGYLAGGIAFGPFQSRNITPSVEGPTTGSLTNFKQVMRTGVDLRKLHTPISPLLQVMPWPIYGELNDKELDAIYAFLSAIPCVEGGPEEKPNRCGRPAASTTAVAEPKTSTVMSPQIQLDGTKSTSADGKELKYSWKAAAGSPPVGITRADTATPIVQFATGPITYKIELTVTDSAGKTATDTATIHYARSY
jgi:hypothetical protein